MAEIIRWLATDDLTHEDLIYVWMRSTSGSRHSCTAFLQCEAEDVAGGVYSERHDRNNVGRKTAFHQCESIYVSLNIHLLPQHSCSTDMQKASLLCEFACGLSISISWEWHTGSKDSGGCQRWKDCPALPGRPPHQHCCSAAPPVGNV